MYVTCYTRSGARSDIHADVETVRVVCDTQIDLGLANQPHHFRKRVFRRGVERGYVRVRHDHQVTVVVGIAIQYDEIQFATMDDEIFRVFLFCRLDAENACLGRSALGEVRIAPWSPEAVHGLPVNASGAARRERALSQIQQSC
jgi:hypothetical protein